MKCKTTNFLSALLSEMDVTGWMVTFDSGSLTGPSGIAIKGPVDDRPDKRWLP